MDAYVGEVAVACGLGRRGIGTRLMDAAEVCGAGRGRDLTLETAAANRPARALYGRRGYQEGGHPADQGHRVNHARQLAAEGDVSIAGRVRS